MKKISILCGPSGSGKTRYAKEQTQRKVKVIQYASVEKCSNDLVKNFQVFIRNYDTLILDAPFSNQKDYESMYLIMQGKEVKIEFIVFDSSLDTCAWNNRYRSHTSNVHEIDIPNITNMPHAVVTHKTTKRKSGYDLFKDKFNLPDQITSMSWSLGGTWADCWGNVSTASPSSQPVSFVEFDELLEKICPDITFLKYKRIYNELVDIDDNVESDYYGGSITYAKYRCNSGALYRLLDELGLLDDEFKEGK